MRPNNEESQEGGLDIAMVAIANVVPALTQNELEESVLQNPIQVSCPLAFSNGLKDGIEQALKSVLEAVVPVRRIKKTQIRPTATSINRGNEFDDWLFDGLDDIENENYNDNDVTHEILDEDDGFSVGETDQLQGLSALQQLLSYAKKKDTNGVNRKGRNRGATSKNRSILDESDEGSDSDDSLESFVTGPGNRALQTLLTSVATKQPGKRKRVEN